MNGWIIKEIRQWNLIGYKFMAIKEDFSEMFGYRYVYGFTMEEVMSKCN